MPLKPRRIHAPGIEGVPRGRAVLLDFWDYTCVNCLRTLPYMREWHRRYGPLGLALVGVHAPEFSFARSRENVEAAARELSIEYPVVLDNEYRAWQAFATKYWPTKYLVDAAGYLRYSCEGEGRYAETEAAIQDLLREERPRLALPPLMEPVRVIDRPGALAVCQPSSPELHLADARGRAALEGAWRNDQEYIESGTGARLGLDYAAAEVNAVIEGQGQVTVLDNGGPLDHQSRAADICEKEDGRTVVVLDRPRLYRMVERDRFLRRRLELSFPPGVRVYAFSFGTCVPRP